MIEVVPAFVDFSLPCFVFNFLALLQSLVSVSLRSEGHIGHKGFVGDAAQVSAVRQLY